MKLMSRQWEQIMGGLAELDGYRDEDNHRVVFKFSPVMRLRIARAMARIENAHSEMEKARIKLVKDYGVEGLRPGDPKLTEEQSKNLRDYLVAVNEAKSEDVEIGMPEFSIKDLDLDKNQIPNTTLAKIAPLIADFEKEEE